LLFNFAAPYYQEPGQEETGKVAAGMESALVCYWVMPPPESRPQEYGRPMLMSYSVNQDQFLSQDALNEMVNIHIGWYE
jgi:hypothetical protein